MCVCGRAGVGERFRGANEREKHETRESLHFFKFNFFYSIKTSVFFLFFFATCQSLFQPKSLSLLFKLKD